MVSLKPILRGRGQLALQCACGGWGEARRRHEPKLHVKANEERRFEPRSVDYLGMESPMNRGCCQFFLKVDWQTCIID